MYFLLSGEGPTDLGLCAGGAPECEGKAFHHGPMAIIVAQVVEQKLGYAFLEGEHYGYVSKRTLVDCAAALKAMKKKVRLPGKKQPRETRYFFNNARALARLALEKQRVRGDVAAILFRDSDGTASAGRGLWEDKRRSMMAGFEAEGFPRGVPMIPKPASEAWLLCALKTNPYQACDALESRSGSSTSPHSLKAQLHHFLGERATREELNALLADRTIDISRIEMPSLRAFRQRLEQVITA